MTCLSVLCNVAATFQRCMMRIFFGFPTKIVELFVDDFTVHGDSFDECLHHLTLLLRRCIETNLVLNFKKRPFMVKHGVVLGHVDSAKGIVIDKEKIDIIQSLPCPQIIRAVRSF